MMMAMAAARVVDFSIVIMTRRVKGVAERGKETNTHFFFSWVWLTPPPTPYLPNIVCFLSSDVFFECFLVI